MYPVMVRFLLLLSLGVVAAGCGGSGDRTVSGVTPEEGARSRFQALLGTDGVRDLRSDYEFFAAYYQAYPDDPVGVLGYAITRTGYAAQQVLDSHGIGGTQIAALVSFSGALDAAASGGAAAILEALVSAATGSGILPAAGATATTPARTAAEIRTVLIPALADSIEALGPLTQRPGVLATFTDEGTETVICAEEAGAYRGMLGLALCAASTATAYSWETGDFDWNRTPAEMDANGDHLLTPGEYLPGAPFLSLTDPTLMAQGWLALNTALADLGSAAIGMTGDVDPRQLLARESQDTQGWTETAQGIALVQLALIGPTTVPIPYTDPISGAQQVAPASINPRVFWTNPPMDLRPLMPTLRYEDGAGPGLADTVVELVPDPTFAGLIPNGAGLPDAFWDRYLGQIAND